MHPFPPLPGYVPEHRRLERFDHTPGGASHHGRLGARPPASNTSVIPTVDEHVARILTETGFPALLIEWGSVVLSGFVLVPESPTRVRIRWIGSPEVDDLPYRRTFLGVYAQTLREAGLAVAYVEDRDEPYLICQAGGTPPGFVDLPD